MKQDYEQKLKLKNEEISDLKRNIAELQKKIDMANMEIKAMREASDQSNQEKLKEIERLKKIIQDLEEEINRLKSNSSSQVKELEE